MPIHTAPASFPAKTGVAPPSSQLVNRPSLPACSAAYNITTGKVKTPRGKCHPSPLMINKPATFIFNQNFVPYFPLVQSHRFTTLPSFLLSGSFSIPFCTTAQCSGATEFLFCQLLNIAAGKKKRGYET
ncbi:uncharacterized protein UV8b_03356 [Ustilaginoidea virens]|uniref:Uncharacterized protein n=1 Tax=Ustilaginoidea virens TaxID=1159556 RepID=A0A8E5HP77_USTVR|nr:uncharacterized protein UV8b_03356 [Ustilaginoidea virens]QUC19115.1 hypothetical protein UV8b_03356 [Ustilaginoidea virens]